MGGMGGKGAVEYEGEAEAVQAEAVRGVIDVLVVRDLMSETRAGTGAGTEAGAAPIGQGQEQGQTQERGQGQEQGQTQGQAQGHAPGQEHPELSWDPEAWALHLERHLGLSTR